MHINVDDYAEMPELPQGVVDRLSAVMSLWHTDPWKARWFIDPKLAEKMWGPSRSGKAAEPAISNKVEADICQLWLTDPERAVLYVKPTEAIKRYGRPKGVDATRLIELHKLYLKVQSHVGVNTPDTPADNDATFEIYNNIQKSCGSDESCFHSNIDEMNDAGKD
jgi:hypothetical protein